MATPTPTPITVETVLVGNPGNAADTTGYGSVAYSYNIGKYEVTIGQYTAFLNAVAATDTYGLYNTSMGTDMQVAGITRSGSSGNYTYSVMTNNGQDMTNRPITYVSWFDAARFANWMANGQPAGAQGNATTENGAYSLNEATSRNLNITKNAINPNTGQAVSWWIPSEDEWYKAAYYDPNKAGGAGYWLYPTQNDSAPGNVIGSGANQANYKCNNYSTGSAPYITNGGAFSGSASHYGTYDQSGNVWEWNDAVISNSFRGVRGGSWYDYLSDNSLKSTYRYGSYGFGFGPDYESLNWGFRCARTASTPEPVAISMVKVGDPGNAADPTTGYGSVSYSYSIGKYDVTIGQYTAFLNAVAKTDTYGLYHPNMGTDLIVSGGITRSGSSGNYTYSVMTISGQDMTNRPITYVSWFDAARFANWMHNGQGSASTETGAYTLNGATSGVITKNASAKYWIPSEDEWYKAAYYDSSLGGVGVGGYWTYATKSNALSSTKMNYNVGHTTNVGAYNFPSAYGTYDQAGNVWQWNDAVIGGNLRCMRGGAYLIGGQSSNTRGDGEPTFKAGFAGFRLAAVPDPLATMALIPAGGFSMGDALDGLSNAPVHTVNVSAFYMEKKLVTKGLWDEVRAWGLTNGYTDLPAGVGKASNHPVQTISWYAMVKWCNARSEKEGLTPCYTLSGAVYKTTDNNSVVCDFTANGYRLPTEAEWEKAGRGNLSGKRFPWGDTVSQSQANYYGAPGSYSYDLSSALGNNPAYATGGIPYTSPVGSFGANGYDLYDMAGNVWEGCWDWWETTYKSGVVTDPTGPASGANRVVRGGGWYDDASYSRVAFRNSVSPSVNNSNFGFRCARTGNLGNLSLSGNSTFGDVIIGQQSTKTVTITNNGTVPVNVIEITGPTGYSFSWTQGEIAAGASQAVDVTFAPTVIGQSAGNMVVASDDPGGAALLALSAAGVPVPAVVTVTSPNGGESFAAGLTQTISWTSSGPAGSVVAIELLRNGQLLGAISDSAANTGSYSWTIPALQAVGTGYAVRVRSVSSPEGTDTSDATFDIKAGIPVASGLLLGGGAADTSSISVGYSLTRSGGDPTDMRLSESATLTGASWQAFSATGNVTLSGGGGVKIVYAQVRNSYGESAVVSDSIRFVVPPSPNWQQPTGRQYNMTVYARVLDSSGNPLEFAGSRLMASENGAVAGVISVSDGPNATKVYLLTVSSQSAASRMSFEFYNAATGQVTGLSELLDFQPNRIVGTISNPQILHVAGEIKSQTIPLAAGWNWISWNLDPADGTANALLAGYLAENNDIIKGAGGAATFQDGVWYSSPSGFEFVPGQMYMLYRKASGNLTLKAPIADTRAVQSLVKGWNWLGYVPQSAAAVGQALSRLAAEDNVMVKSQTSFSTFFGGAWYPATFQMEPGRGYMLKLERAGTFAYEGNATLSARSITAYSVERQAVSAAIMDAAKPAWQSPVGKQFSMIVYAQVTGPDNQPIDEKGSQLAAFIGQDIAGVAERIDGPGGTALFQLQVFSDQTPVTGLAFSVYDARTGLTHTVKETQDFTADSSAGTLSQPLALTVEAAAGGGNSTVAITPGDFKTLVTSNEVTLLGTLKLCANRSFTGKFPVGGKLVGFRGVLDLAGRDSIPLSGGGTLALEYSVGTQSISATFTPSGGQPTTYTFDSAAYTGKTGNLSPLNGRAFNSLLIPQGTTQPAGNGYVCFKFDKRGAAAFVGRLSDGSILTGKTTTVNSDSGTTLPIAVVTKGRSVVGELAVDASAAAGASILSGALDWKSGENPHRKLLPLGFEQTLDVNAIEWSKAARGINLLTRDATANAKFTLNMDTGSAVLKTPIAAEGSWSGKNQIGFTTANAKITVAPATGALTGRVTIPNTGGAASTKVLFTGLLLGTPVENAETGDFLHGGGFLLGPAASAEFEIITKP